MATGEVRRGHNTPSLAEEAGRDEAVPIPTIPDCVLSAVCEVYHVEPLVVMGVLRTNEYATARQVIAHILRHEHQWTIERIGNAMRTGFNATWKRVRKCDDLLAVDKTYKRLYGEALLLSLAKRCNIA